jgi:AraC-like DNA-binding protein
MVIQYDEWLPAPALRDVISAYWYVTGDGRRVPSPQILPDGHIEIVLNLGDPVRLKGPAYTGEQPMRVVVGPLTRAVRITYTGRVRTFGIRFHPARGAGFLGLRATILADRLIPLGQVCAPLDRALLSGLPGTATLDDEASRAAVDLALLGQLGSALPPDREIVVMVDRLVRSEGAPLVAEMAVELGLSSRQLQRRFLTAVGTTPKRFMRVTRFARVWQLATMRPPEAWAELAAEHGYADQAHLIREFRSFGAEPPARLFSSEWYEATALARATGPARGRRDHLA